MNIGAFGENFPYTNFHDLNLDWIIKTMKELRIDIDNFKPIKIADPPEWDIHNQYEQGTITFHENTMYVALQDVPKGTLITNTDYWQPVMEPSALSIANPAQWNANSDYEKDTIVSYNNRLYASIRDSVANIPPTNTNYWRLVYEPEPVRDRVWGKQIAVYGDSWATEAYGGPWLNYLAEKSGMSVHVRAQGSLALPTIYSTLWDNYNADIYIIEGGLNDCTLNTHANTFMTAIESFVTSIRNINPSAEIYFMTPTNITRSNLLHYLYPLEFYRTCIWRLAGKNRYNVINGLKITDINYRDQVHPTTETSVNIGKHIVEAINTYGDEETHMNEITTLGRDNTQILFTMYNGVPGIRIQTASITMAQGTGAWAGSWTGTINLGISNDGFLPSMTMFGFSKNNAPQYAFVHVAYYTYDSSDIFIVSTVNISAVLTCQIDLVVGQWQKSVS